MNYKTGDVVVIKKAESINREFVTVLISEIQKSYSGREPRYYGYIENQSGVSFTEKQIISDGAFQDVASEHNINQALSPDTKIDGFFKCALLCLIRVTDKYDLQILYKLKDLKHNHYLDKYGNLLPVAAALSSKLKIQLIPAFTG